MPPQEGDQSREAETGGQPATGFQGFQDEFNRGGHAEQSARPQNAIGTVAEAEGKYSEQVPYVSCPFPQSRLPDLEVPMPAHPRTGSTEAEPRTRSDCSAELVVRGAGSAVEAPTKPPITVRIEEESAGPFELAQ